MRLEFRIPILLLLGGLIARPVLAHHSRAYFGDEVMTISGELVDVIWRNPHIGLDVRVTGADGTAQTWRVEGNSIYNLQRVGIPRERFQPGMAITLSGRTSTREPLRLLLTSIVMPDGQTLTFERRQPPPGYVDKVVDAAAENKGLFRVWSMPAADRSAIQGQVRDLPYTDKALAARANFNPLDSFALRCEPEGMPRIMLNPHPFEFIDRGDQIALRTELYDTERLIHMNVDAPPADVRPSRLGYSIGRWESGALVVRTSSIDWPWFDNAGTPQSADVELIETFTLSEDQSRLDFDLTVSDPATFTQPAHLSGYWLALGESILRYDCQPVSQ